MTDPKPRRSKRARSSVMTVVIGLLIGSAVVRLVGGTGQAIAREIETLSHKDVPVVGAVCEPPPEIAAVLAELTERESRVTGREAEILDRERLLQISEAEVREGLAALEMAEARLSATIATASQVAEEDLAQLTSVYENMKPAVAAPLFQQMDPVFSAGFLGRMRPDAAAAILSGLTPEKAYQISVVLAGRNASVPTE